MRRRPNRSDVSRPVTCAVAAMALASCAAPGVPALSDAAPIPEQWADADRPQATLDIAEYWQLLDDPLLTFLVETAIAENLDIAQGVARLEQTRAQLALARSGYLPQVSGSAGVQRDVLDMAADDFLFSLGADASWEIDLFGRIAGDVAAAEADLLASGYSLADLQRLIVAQVALATISGRTAANQLAIARDTLAFQDDNLQIARWRVQAGLVSSLDVEQARAQRAQIAATVPLLESTLVATAHAISTLIGEPPGRVLELLEGPAAMPIPPMLTGFEPPAEVLRRRPDVRAAEAALVASAARVGVARAQLLPLVRLTGTIGTASLGLDGLFDTITGGLFAGLSQLIYDGGRTSALIAGAEAAADGALAAWRLEILAALEEVETAAVDLRTAAERLAIFEEALDAAENSALLARSQYEAGLTDFQNLLTSENQLLTARNSVVGAEADRAAAFVRLTQALGGGWSPQAFPLPSAPPSTTLLSADRNDE